MPLPLPAKQAVYRRYLDLLPRMDEVLQQNIVHLKRILADLGLRANIKQRVKGFESYYAKLLRRARSGTAKQSIFIPDLLGLRLVVPFLEDLNRLEEALGSAFAIEEIDRKGSTYSSREFGYESTHLLLRLEDDEPTPYLELQLRTLLQDAWAEVEHDLVYKTELSLLDEPLRRKLAAINASLTLADTIFQEIRDYQRRLASELQARRTQFWEGAVDAEVPSASQSDFEEPEFLTTGSGTVDAMLLEGLLAHNRHHYDRAVEIYSKILAEESKESVRSVVLIHRGMARFASKDHTRALSDFTDAVTTDPRNARGYFYRGITHRQLGNRSEALADLDRSLGIDPYNVEALRSRGELLLALGRTDEADDDIRRLREIDPSIALGAVLSARQESTDDN
jgi:putative GTP pyrophosphokinase